MTKFELFWDQKIMGLVHYLICCSSWMVSCALWKVRVFGAHNVPKENYLILSNHQSYLDPVFISAFLQKRIYYILRTTLANIFFRIIMIPFKLIYIRRGTADLSALRRAIEVMRKGESLLVFPEGTRTRDGRIGRLKRGFTLIAKKCNALVLPVHVDGAYTCWPKGQILPTLGSIQVRFARPFSCDEKTSDEEIINKLKQAWQITYDIIYASDKKGQ